MDAENSGDIGLRDFEYNWREAHYSSPGPFPFVSELRGPTNEV